MTQARRNVAIVGVGAVTPAGSNDEDWKRSLSEATGTNVKADAFESAGLPCNFAAPVQGWIPDGWLKPAEQRRYTRSVSFAVSAAHQALDGAGDHGVPNERRAVVIGTGIGGVEVHEHYRAFASDGYLAVSPFVIPTCMANAAAAVVAMKSRASGPVMAPVAACASGAMAIGEAFKMIRDGDVDFALAGGTEASVTPGTVAGFSRMGALSTRNEDPSRASRPFDENRDGFVLGEGAAVVALEAEELAVRRGATILGIVSGYGHTSDGYHLVAPRPDGAGMARAMKGALRAANVGSDDVQHVNAHGTSTPLNDKAESVAIMSVFGRRPVPVTSVKGVTGHLLGASGAFEVVVAVESARTGWVPPTANFVSHGIGTPFDVVAGECRWLEPGPVLTNSFGFGGHNVCLVIEPPMGERVTDGA